MQHEGHNIQYEHPCPFTDVVTSLNTGLSPSPSARGHSPPMTNSPAYVQRHGGALFHAIRRPNTPAPHSLICRTEFYRKPWNPKAVAFQRGIHQAEEARAVVHLASRVVVQSAKEFKHPAPPGRSPAPHHNRPTAWHAGGRYFCHAPMLLF